MIRRSALAAWSAAALLAACASAPETGPFGSGETLSGRLAVRVDRDENRGPRSENAGFELQGSPKAGRLDLSTPLGSVLAQARWAPGSVVLVTPRGEQRFADLNALTREVLGESIPVAAMFDWLKGRPWAGAPSEPLAGTEPGDARGFFQLGWSVNLSKFNTGTVVARRAAPRAVTVRAIVDPS